MAALDRAFALEQVHHVAVLVGQHLELDMAGVRDIALQDQALVAKGVLRLAAGGGDRFAQLSRRPRPRACLCRRRPPRP